MLDKHEIGMSLLAHPVDKTLLELHVLGRVVLGEWRIGDHDIIFSELAICHQLGGEERIALLNIGVFDSVEDHVQALIDHGAPIDAVVVAEDEIPSQIEKRYQKEGSTVVRVAKQSHSYEIIRRPLLCFDRELVRHDPQKIQEAVETLIG